MGCTGSPAVTSTTQVSLGRNESVTRRLSASEAIDHFSHLLSFGAYSKDEGPSVREERIRDRTRWDTGETHGINRTNDSTAPPFASVLRPRYATFPHSDLLQRISSVSNMANGTREDTASRPKIHPHHHHYNYKTGRARAQNYGGTSGVPSHFIPGPWDLASAVFARGQGALFQQLPLFLLHFYSAVLAINHFFGCYTGVNAFRLLFLQTTPPSLPLFKACACEGKTTLQ